MTDKLHTSLISAVKVMDVHNYGKVDIKKSITLLRRWCVQQFKIQSYTDHL